MTDNIYVELPQVGATFADSINESTDYRENTLGGVTIKSQDDNVVAPSDFDLDKLPAEEEYVVGMSTLTPDPLSPQEGVSNVPPYPPFRGSDWTSRSQAPFLHVSEPYNFGPVAEEALACLKGIASLMGTIIETMSRLSDIFGDETKNDDAFASDLRKYVEVAEEAPPKPRVRTKKGAPGRPKRRQPKTKVPQRNKRKTTVLKNTKPKKGTVKAKAKVKPKRR